MKYHLMNKTLFMLSLFITFTLVPKTTHAMNVNPESCEKLMIGAHNPIGDYELYFSVDNTGEIKLLSLKQLKTYPETIEQFQLILPEME